MYYGMVYFPYRYLLYEWNEEEVVYIYILYIVPRHNHSKHRKKSVFYSLTPKMPFIHRTAPHRTNTIKYIMYYVV